MSPAAAALTIVFGGSVACNAPPGTIAGRVVTNGGDGNPIAFTPIAGDIADFAVRPSGVLVVGKNGINPAHCGTNQTLTIRATQQ